MTSRVVALCALMLMGCPPPQREPASPNPIPVPDSDLCAAMCKHIGPKTPENPDGLGCPEGEPVYDSDRFGPKGVPNKSCTDFCMDQQANKVFVNPRCVLQVKSCSEIEAARQKDCS